MAEKQNTPEIRFEGFTDPWEQRKLGEVASEFQSGEFISATEITENGDYPVYGGNGLRGYANRYNHEGFYALIGRQGALCGNVNCADGKAYFTEHAVAVQANQCNDTGFLVYLLSRMNLGQYSGQSAQPGLAVSTLKEVETLLPSKYEQYRIGSLLKDLDSLITLHQRKRKYRGLYGYLSWEQRKLGDMGTTYGGLTGKSKEDFGHGAAWFVPYTNVFDNPVGDSTRLERVEIDPSQNVVRRGDALFTVSSETPEEVGMSSVWPSDLDDLYLNSFCFGYRQDGSFDPSYLAYMLRADSFRNQIEMLAQGISRFNISKGKVMEIEVPVPNKREQARIGRLFVDLGSLITLHQ